MRSIRVVPVRGMPMMNIAPARAHPWMCPSKRSWAVDLANHRHDLQVAREIVLHVPALDAGALLNTGKGLLVLTYVLQFLRQSIVELNQASGRRGTGDELAQLRDVIALRRLEAQLRASVIGFILGGLERDRRIKAGLGAGGIAQIALHGRLVEMEYCAAGIEIDCPGKVLQAAA